MPSGHDWTRDEQLIALNLYGKLPFGRFDQRNPIVIAVAERIGRTPGSVAMKLSNFASLDPFHIARGIKGLSGVSNADRAIWAEFHARRAELAPESEELFRACFATDEADAVEVIRGRGVVVTRETAPPGPTEKLLTKKVRYGQQFFRQAVLNRFDNRCGVTGIAVRSLLIASHVVPWSDDEAERLNPSNGLCLSRLHDAAFDQFLTTFDEDYRLVLSRELREHFDNNALRQHFEPYAGERLAFLEKLPAPSAELLAKHRARFRG